MLNFLDPQIFNILAEPIKRDLHLFDWQLGSLTSLSFALFYASPALYIARLAESGDRVKIIAASAIPWSLFTGLRASPRTSYNCSWLLLRLAWERQTSRPLRIR